MNRSTRRDSMPIARINGVEIPYEVLGDIELLPTRLPALYRMLTD
jgi:hypothetical protein